MTLMNQKWQDLPRRLLTIGIGAPTVLALTYLGSPFYDFIVLSVSLLATFEIIQMIDANDRFWRLTLPFMMIMTVLTIAYGWYQITLGIYIIIFATWYIIHRKEVKNKNINYKIIYFIIALLYVGVSLALLLPARATSNGFWWTLALLVNNWTTDGFALLGGRLFGKRKLAPKISGSKTIEGAGVGLIVGTIAGFAIVTITIPMMSLGIALIANFLIAVLTIVGDLIESRVKRYFQIKDAGKFLPGHGGFLDRIDGLILAIPFWYLFVMFS